MTDPINPSYYSAAGIESIQVIEAFVQDKPYRWAALKYLFRAGKKRGQDEVEDLKKAIWWIEREITVIEQRRHMELQSHVAKIAARAPGTCPDIDQEYDPVERAQRVAGRALTGGGLDVI